MDVNELDDVQLLEEFDEVLLESYPGRIEEVLGNVRVRFEQLISKKPIDPSLLSRLSEIISYPGNLNDSDVKTLEAILLYFKPPTEI